VTSEDFAAYVISIERAFRAGAIQERNSICAYMREVARNVGPESKLSCLVDVAVAIEGGAVPGSFDHA
jgi:hypothetical protein